VSRLLTDSSDQDRHLSLKRFERGAQRVAWSKRAAEQSAPPLPCPWRASPESPVLLRQAHVLALFAGDLALVRFPGLSDNQGEAGGLRVLRGGIPWDQWCPVLLTAYRNATPVPEPFRPRLRLPPQWPEQALGWKVEDQRRFFEKLREGGTLPPLKKITAEAVAPWLQWDELRQRLMDFTV
jgi:hypothetical protein